MKRPFALLGGVSFSAVMLAAVLEVSSVMVLSVLCLGTGAAILLTLAVLRLRNAAANRTLQKLPRSCRSGVFSVRGVFLALALLVGAFCLFRYAREFSVTVAPMEQLAGTEARIRGTVQDHPSRQYGRYYYLVGVERLSVDGESRELPRFTLRVSTGAPFACRPYDTLECTVKFLAFSEENGLYSGRNSWLASGVSAQAYLSDYETVMTAPNTTSPPGKLFAELRHTIGRSFEKHLPSGESGLIRAMLLGERDRVSEEAHCNFKAIGASHLLVISGLHMAALGVFLSLLFGTLPMLGRTGKNLLTAGAVVGFLALTGFPVSAVRSGIMYLLALLADCLGREPDSVNSLGFAVLVICVVNPFSGGDLGFALSVSATLGILLLANRMTAGLLELAAKRPRFQRLCAPVASSLGVTCSAMLFTLPIQLLVFRSVSLLAPLSSLLLVFPCTLLLYCSLLAAFFGLLPALSPMAEPFFYCAGILARCSMGIADRLARLTRSMLDLSDPVWVVAVLGIGAVAAFGYFLKRSRRATCTVLAGMLLIFSCGRAFAAVREDTVTVAATADSSCVVLLRGSRAAVLTVGGFQESAARELLTRNGVEQIELLCLPEQSEEANEAAAQLLGWFPVEKLALPKGAYLRRDLESCANRSGYFCPENGETMEVLGEVKLTFLKDMSRISVTANSTEILVETGETGTGECQILFTTAERTKINSAFTVLQNGDIIEKYRKAELARLLPGRYLLPEGNGLFIDLLSDGVIRFRGDSICLK